MKARAKLIEGMAFLGEAGSGHALVMDGASKSGGRHVGFRPMELLLGGLAGCTASGAVMILRRGREEGADCVVQVAAERAPEDPKIFAKLHLDDRMKGKKRNKGKVKRAIELSAEKYCSASIMLVRSAEITHAFAVGRA